jgi:hypothetical protein
MPVAPSIPTEIEAIANQSPCQIAGRPFHLRRTVKKKADAVTTVSAGSTLESDGD